MGGQFNEERQAVSKMPMGNQNDRIGMPTGSDDDDAIHQRAIMLELADIESKVVWELENWKRAEEARFKFSLKQKEAEHAERMKEEWRAKEIEKERLFRDMENKMMAHTQKIQSKITQLNKRESRLVLLEEELKQKIGETSRQLSQKDAEIDEAKLRSGEDKKLLQKKIKDLEERNRKLEEIGKNLEEDLRLYKIEQERSPIEIVKKELAERMLEISQLKKEIEKTVEIKEEYRKHFERLKDEVLRLKKERDHMLGDARSQHEKEMQILRNQLNMIAQSGQNGETQTNFNQFREELFKLKGGTGGAESSNLPQLPLIEPSHNNTQVIRPGGLSSPPIPLVLSGRPSANTGGVDRNFHHSGTYTDPKDGSNLNRLYTERDILLKQGYLETDPLVRQVEEAIRGLKS